MREGEEKRRGGRRRRQAEETGRWNRREKDGKTKRPRRRARDTGTGRGRDKYGERGRSGASSLLSLHISAVLRDQNHRELYRTSVLLPVRRTQLFAHYKTAVCILQHSCIHSSGVLCTLEHSCMHTGTQCQDHIQKMNHS